MDQPFLLSDSEPSTQTLGEPTRSEHGSSDLRRTGLRRGTCLGRHVIYRCLGSGGMGNVFAAYDPELDRRVALKVLRADLWSSEHGEAAKRLLLREARAAAKLSHPHVVALYDVGTVDDRLFLTMELIDGCTLTEWLELSEPDWKRTLEVLIQAGEGLAAAHRAGLVHRDFKPANLMISRDGHCKVVDFGLAKPLGRSRPATNGGAPGPLADADLGSVSSALDSLGTAGPAAGTPAYMAPEQRGGRAADGRSDQFSFCLTAYEALFGESPFEGHHHGTPRSSGESATLREPAAGSPVPGRIRKALLRGLAYDPEARYPSMQALLDELRPRPERRWRWWSAGAGVLVVAGALAGFHQARLERQQLCTGAEQRLVGLWDSSRKDAISRAMYTSGSQHAEEAWRRVESQVDDYTRRWVTAHTKVCEATHLRGEQSPALLDRQMTCLDERLTEVASLSAWLLAAGSREIDQAAGIAAGLSGIAACIDRRQTLRSLEPPAPDLAPRVTTIRRQIAEAKTAQAAGHYSRATELAAAGLEAAREVDYPPLRAEAHYRLGLAHGRLGHAPELRRHLSRAIDLGLATGHRQIVARAMVYQMVYGFLTRDPVDSRTWAQMAKGAIEAAGGSPTVEAQRLLMLGITAENEQEYELAIEHYRAALDTAPEKTLLLVGSVLNNVGKAYQRLGDLETAEEHLRRGIDVTEKAYGPWHPLVGSSLESLADLLTERGELAEAVELRWKALGIFEVSPGPGHPAFVESLVALGKGLLATGEAARAQLLLQRARDLLATGDGPAASRAPALPAEVDFLLARSRHAQGAAGSEIRPLLRAARQRFLGLGSAGAAQLESLDRWMEDEQLAP